VISSDVVVVAIAVPSLAATAGDVLVLSLAVTVMVGRTAEVSVPLVALVVAVVDWAFAAVADNAENTRMAEPAINQVL